MKNISLNIDKVTGFVTREQILALEPQVKSAQKALEEGTLPGNDFLGWLHLPSSITKEDIADINATAQTLRENCEVVVVAGIGGSYLGARAVIEALSNNFAALIGDNKNPRWSSHCFFKRRNARAVSVVVPDFEMLITPNFLSLRYSVSS